VSDLAGLTRDYRTAFLRYLPRREEVALSAGYEIGRAAVSAGVSMLELARIHHEVLLEVLGDCTTEQVADVATAASEFFLEALATHDMAQRVSRTGADASTSAPPGQDTSRRPPVDTS
jgi:hypothetical protein